MDVNDALDAQRRYARWLAWGVRLGLGLLAVTFVAYAGGFIAPHVPIEQLPQLWSRPASDLLQQTGVRAGWGWAAFLGRADMMVLAAIALLSTCSLACLAAAIPVFARQGERALVAICVLEILVVALAASGLFAAH